jgi:hypothetical protein
MDLGLGDIASSLGFGSGTVVPDADSGQMGNGKWSTSLISAMITAGVGLTGSYLDQKTKRQALEQSNKQAEDAYKLEQQKLALAGGSASAAAALAKKKMMMDAYQAYSDSYSRAGTAAQSGWQAVANSMQAPLLLRAK